jgi:hypothetical protein
VTVAELITELHGVPYDQPVTVDVGSGAARVIGSVFTHDGGAVLMARETQGAVDGMAEFKRQRGESEQI